MINASDTRVTCEYADLATVWGKSSPANASTLALHVNDTRILHSLDTHGLRARSDIERLITDGWAEGAKDAQSLAQSLAPHVPQPTSIRRRMRWADDGNDLSVDRALAGQWDAAWRRPTRVPVHAPRVLDLVCAWGGSFDRPATQLAWQGAQMVAACDLLEAAGFAVNLYAMQVAKYRTEIASVCVQVKRSDQPLRLDAIMATFGHAAVFRSLGFSLIACLTANRGAGLGYPQPLTAAHAPVLDALILPDAYTRDTAAHNIRRLLSCLESEDNNQCSH